MNNLLNTYVNMIFKPKHAQVLVSIGVLSFTVYVVSSKKVKKYPYFVTNALHTYKNTTQASLMPVSRILLHSLYHEHVLLIFKQNHAFSTDRHDSKARNTSTSKPFPIYKLRILSTISFCEVLFKA